MSQLQRALNEYRGRLLTLAEIAEGIATQYTSAIREYARKQVYEEHSNISYGYAMGLWTALGRVEGVREQMWMDRERAIATAKMEDEK